MMLHIFRKDWKLTWRFVVGVALLNLMRVVLAAIGDPIQSGLTPRVYLMTVSHMLSLAAAAILVVIVVQRDALPGLRQDWLVRPIRRTDLLLSKLAFVVLLVQGPLFVIELCGGLLEGLPAGQVVGAAVGRSLWMLLVLILPLAAFATLTRNLMEALAAGLAGVLCYALFSVYTSGIAFWGISWIPGSLQVACLLLGAAAVLGLQYYGRKTLVSRAIGGAVIVATQLVLLLPWQSAFAIQERFSPEPSAANGVQITAGPGLRSFVLHGANAGSATVLQPIQITGVGEKQKVMLDSVRSLVIETNGRVNELQQEFDTSDLEGILRRRDARLSLPVELVNRIRGHSAKLELDYSLTLFEEIGRDTMPVEGRQSMDGLGRCVSRINFPASRLELRCRVPGRAPCADWSVSGISFPVGRSVRGGCSPDYSPYFDSLALSAVDSYYQIFPFRDSDETELKNARLVMHTWRPVAHFTRRVSVPDFRIEK